MNMKKATMIVLIVLGVLVLGAVAVGVLNALLADGQWTFGWTDYHYDDSQYTVGDGTIYATDLTSVSVDWIDGTVQIVVCQDDYPSVTESAPGALTDDSRMRWCVSADGKSLSIKYRKSSSFFGTSENKQKDLILRVPERMLAQLNAVNVKVVSSDLTVDGIAVENLKVESVSGDVTLLLPADKGFTLTSETVSGGAPTIDFGVEQKDGAYICGDGHSKIAVKTVSGEVHVKKREN
ncbi:MAG: DUF4097 family beta strand repeat protein [Clostridia bacterium]|nr:DUF4097 family beta strand repeat protein [Clostridia bacterium]